MPWLVLDGGSVAHVFVRTEGQGRDADGARPALVAACGLVWASWTWAGRSRTRRLERSASARECRACLRRGPLRLRVEVRVRVAEPRVRVLLPPLGAESPGSGDPGRDRSGA